MRLERLQVERDGPVARVWLNRPEARNAFDGLMVTELRKTLFDLFGQDAVRVIVLGGRGASFCAGADLAWMKAETRGRISEILAGLQRSRRLTELYTRTVLPQATAAVTAAVSAYRVGRIDFMNVLDNRMTVNRYLQELVTLGMEQGQAWAELEMLIGQELFDPWSVAEPAKQGGGPDE